MTTLWKSALLCSAFTLSALSLPAQNATTGGDQRPQQDVQGMRGGGRRGSATRGTVVSLSGPNITLKDDNDVTWTVITTENTRVMRARDTIPLSAIQQGDEVAGIGMPDADRHELHAMMVMDVPAAEAAKARANLGKTYIVGRITAIDEVKLTVLRSDKVSQTIQLDDSTSLHRGGRMDPSALEAAGIDATALGMGGFGGGPRGGNGQGGGRRNGGIAPDATGESVTLADVKVGDSVVGLGSVKGGVFVPTDLRIQSRPAGGGPRRQGGNGETLPPQQQ